MKKLTKVEVSRMLRLEWNEEKSDLVDKIIKTENDIDCLSDLVLQIEQLLGVDLDHVIDLLPYIYADKGACRKRTQEAIFDISKTIAEVNGVVLA